MGKNTASGFALRFLEKDAETMLGLERRTIIPNAPAVEAKAAPPVVAGGVEEAHDLLDDAAAAADSAARDAELERDLEVEIRQSRLIQLVESCLAEAVRSGASDIHVIPGDGNSVNFYLRQDGKLRLWKEQCGVKPEAVAAVVKDRSRNVDRFEREAAQDGFIQRTVDGHRIRFRVSILPVVGGEFERKLESTVIRVLDDRRVITDLARLGLDGRAREDFEKAIESPQGMVVLTGPTGSGKSTTLLAALHRVMSPEVNVITVEEPVEYLIPGARQVKLSHRLDFDQAVRAILRHDPDIVMVGEIRDLKTAEIAVKLANTGHLTFSTLHTNDAVSVVSRLFKMGVEPFLIANAVNIVVAQRLVRALCPACKQPAGEPDARLLARLGARPADFEGHIIYRPAGCAACHRGYKGRVAIHEALYFSRDVRRLISECGADIREEAIAELARGQGMLTLRESGIERVKAGVTSCEEIVATTMPD